MTTIQVRNTRWQVPTAWDELSDKTLFLLARYVLQKRTIGECSRNIALRMLGYRQLFFPKAIRMQLRWHVEESIEFLFGENKLNKNIIKKFRHRLIVYHGPEDKLKNVTGDEFAQADLYFNRYQVNKKQEDLDLFVSCLYRPTSLIVRVQRYLNGRDLRVSFNNKIIHRRARRIKKLSVALKQAIVMNYIGMRNHLIERHPHVFTKSNQEQGSKGGWPNVFLNLAGSKMGTDEQIQKKTIWNILYVAEQNELSRIASENVK